MEIWEKTILGRRDSQYKGPEVGAKLEVKGTVLEISNINCKLRAPHGHRHFRQLATNLEVSQVPSVLVTHCNKSRNSGKQCTCYYSFVVAKEQKSQPARRKDTEQNLGLRESQMSKLSFLHGCITLLVSVSGNMCMECCQPRKPTKRLCPEFYQDFIT